jgi:hypothetical protein
MRGRRRKIIEDDAKSLGSQIPSLSMFVILLAFFVLLNSISTLKTEKVKPMMESIEGAFASKISATEDWQPSNIQDEQKAAGEGRVSKRIEGMFTAQIAGIETQEDATTGTLLMRMKYDDFAAAISSTGNNATANQQFMRTWVSMMRSDNAGHPYRMDAFLQVGDNPAELQSEQPQKMTVLMRDLSVMAQQLEKAGLPQKLMTIGMEQGQDGMIELLFRPHVPYSPLGTKGGE